MTYKIGCPNLKQGVQKTSNTPLANTMDPKKDLFVNAKQAWYMFECFDTNRML